MAKNQDWIDLCKYVKKELLQYDDSIKFPKYLALRLKGLSEGKFIANNNTKPKAKYSFKTILLTCMIIKPKVLNYFKNNTAKIKDENHKINLIMMFIEQEINNVVIKIEERERTKKELDKLNIPDYKPTEYKKHSNKENKNLKDLW